MLSRDKQVMAAVPPMAAADNGGLRRLFEKPLPENPTLLEALSAWNRNVHHHPGSKPIDTASITEIFGELHFHEAPAQHQQPDHHHHHRGVLLPTPPTSPPAPRSSPPSRAPASWLDIAAEAENKSKDDSSLDALLRPKPAATKATAMKRSASFCAKKGSSSSSSASLLLCTEGLGSESTVDADDMFKDGDAEAEAAAALIKATDETDGSNAGDAEKKVKEKEERQQQPKTFPPPIRSIGRGGKPYVCFRSVREDGRFVLREVVIPGKELLQATREGGRLRLQFAAAAVAAAAAAAAGGKSVDDVVHGGDDDDDHRGKNSCIDA